MASTTIYDDAAAYRRNFKTALPDPLAASATHIGFYLAWALHRGLAAPAVSAAGAAVLARQASGGALLLAQCDGQLGAAALNDQGNAFTRSYYLKHYFKDYRQVFGIESLANDNFCRVPDTWDHFDRIAARLDERWQAWSLPDKKALMQRLEAAFLPLLDAHGFERYPYEFSQPAYEISVFRRTGPWGEHKVRLHAVDDRPRHYGLQVEGTSCLTVLAQAMVDDAVIDFDGVSRVLPSSSYFPASHWLPNPPVPLQSATTLRIGNMLPITATAQIDTCITQLRDAAEARLLPLLAQVETLDGFDALYNTVPLSASPVFRHHLERAPLLCAALVGNPRLPAMCDEVEQALDAGVVVGGSAPPAHAVAEMRAHLQRLRAQVPPTGGGQGAPGPKR
ncbi:MAG: hypothetical protein IV093_06395 [Rubrivivax sp.]|nr:hypothetical protein [Rubrivivax sp.]